jgi:hypothetical protein
VKEDKLAAINEKLEAVLVTKRSEYTEICPFRRAKKHCDETVNDYAIRLRHLAKHCDYGTNLGVQSSENNRGDPYRFFKFFFIYVIFISLKSSR